MKELAEATGIPNEEILGTLQELGYTHKAGALLHLVPLINVAWARVEEASPTYQQLEDWLQNRPDEELFEQTLSHSPPGAG